MNLYPLLRQLSVKNKHGLVVPFVPNASQIKYYDTVHDQLNAGKPIRIICLKSRQIGFSTATQALVFTQSIMDENRLSLIIAHENDPAKNLLGMSRLFWNTYPFSKLYTEKYNARNALGWTNGSTITVTTANNVNIRGSTFNFLHGSEVAFWANAEETMVSLRQAIPNNPNSAIILESTANGVGNYFHQQWLAARAGESEFTPLFFPWHQDDDCQAEMIPGLSAGDHLGFLDEEERALEAMGVSNSRLVWRRYAIKNLVGGDINAFHQEYPATEEEAFIQSGTNVFPLDKLRQVYEPKRGAVGRLRVMPSGEIEFIHDTQGPLTIFKWPSSSAEYGLYVIGGDPTRTGQDASRRGDFTCAQVLNRRTLEQVAVWRGRVDPQTFAQILAELGKYFGWALLAPEMQGSGYATIGKLSGMNYPNIYQHISAEKLQGQVAQKWGWSTNSQSKPMAINTLLKYIIDGVILLHDKETFTELTNYVVLDGGGYGPGGAGLHDDTVSALAITAAVIFLDVGSVQPYGSSSTMASEIFTPKPTVAEKLAAVDEGPVWESWGEQNGD